MRILHVTNHVMEIGNGIVNVAVDLACTQSDQGHEVYYVSSGGGYEALLAEHNVKHYKAIMRKSPTAVPKMLISFLEILKYTRPDIVHAHMMTGAIIAKLCQLRFQFKLVTHVHNEFQKSARLMGVGNAVIAVSEAVRQSMIVRGIHCNKIFVIRNGTTHSPRVLPAEPINLRKPAVLTVAGLYERKGIRDLIQAFSMLPDKIDAYLYIVGEGPDRQTFENLAKDSKRSDKIYFEGFQRQPHRYYPNADVFVLASHKEPFGLVLLEARDYGCAIISTNVDGTPEALENGAAGILVPAGKPDALMLQILYLLQNEPARKKLGLRAQENLSDYTVERMTEDVINLYKKIL